MSARENDRYLSDASGTDVFADAAQTGQGQLAVPSDGGVRRRAERRHAVRAASAETDGDRWRSQLRAVAASTASALEREHHESANQPDLGVPADGSDKAFQG